MRIKFKSCTFGTCDRFIHGASSTVWKNGIYTPNIWCKTSVDTHNELRELIGLID